jgi:hypothetical protein
MTDNKNELTEDDLGQQLDRFMYKLKSCCSSTVQSLRNCIVLQTRHFFIYILLFYNLLKILKESN